MLPGLGIRAGKDFNDLWGPTSLIVLAIGSLELFAREDVQQHWGMSSVRSRRGGRTKGKTLSRLKQVFPEGLGSWQEGGQDRVLVARHDAGHRPQWLVSPTNPGETTLSGGLAGSLMLGSPETERGDFVQKNGAVVRDLKLAQRLRRTAPVKEPIFVPDKARFPADCPEWPRNGPR
jgi:hypothetical protein